MNGYVATPQFRSKAVSPGECLKAGWNLVKGQYWLFFGICAIGLLIGSLVPLGILMGPMMCGIYLSFFKLKRGQPVELNDLFKGFDYFVHSLVATMIHMIPVMVIFVPTYIVFYISMFAMMAQQGDRPDPSVLLGFFGIFAVVWIVIIIVLLALSVVFTFAYPLIVDRKLSGVDAVKLSIKAGLANFWRVLGLLLLNGLIGLLGVMACYVGIFFIFPITMGALATAYEQVFGLSEEQPNLPPPPPTFA